MFSRHRIGRQLKNRKMMEDVFENPWNSTYTKKDDGICFHRCPTCFCWMPSRAPWLLNRIQLVPSSRRSQRHQDLRNGDFHQPKNCEKSWKPQKKMATLIGRMRISKFRGLSKSQTLWYVFWWTEKSQSSWVIRAKWLEHNFAYQRPKRGSECFQNSNSSQKWGIPKNGCFISWKILSKWMI